MRSPLVITNTSCIAMESLDDWSIMICHNDDFSTGDIHPGSDHSDGQIRSTPLAMQQTI
ncbi:hypothetical protein HPP92_013932 [Vanilla planifolia]|uniref:Uncharacterized protein n=1 Tax=Vanilla planifolia TaxID=51239 RepID=A0A835QJ35_VANPL|nr:hypothetical protein HPP92_013932 [Vanilla planifolia]